MKFLKLVIKIAIAYFFAVLMWLLFYEKDMQLFMLGLQAITFGIIAAGYNYFSKHSSRKGIEKSSKTL